MSYYDAVVFDNDGVLVGRTHFEVLREATWDAFDAVGVDDPDPDDVEELTIGVTPETLKQISRKYGLDPSTLWRERDRSAFHAQREEVHAGRKTLYDDVGTLTDVDVPMGIVSSNQQSTVDYVLDHFGVDDLFETAYGREPHPRSLRRKKPEPHYLEEALSDIGAERAIFVGDNESDVIAAHNAGIDAAFIRRPHRRDWDLNVSPEFIIHDLHDIHRLATVGA